MVVSDSAVIVPQGAPPKMIDVPVKVDRSVPETVILRLSDGS